MTTKIRVYTCTWNVAVGNPPDDLSSLLQINSEKLPNIYAIGFQELSPPTAVIPDLKNHDQWNKKLHSLLSSKNYIRVRFIRMMGISLAIYVRRIDLILVNSIESQYTKTGFSGFLGNKGGVSIRLEFSGVNICFVTCHLAAHLPQLAQRILDYDAIIQNQRFNNSDSPTILDHDYVFWLGDLNFRLDDIGYEDACETIKNGDFNSLLQYDQLLKVMKDGLVFVDFVEGPIRFPPTYKFDSFSDSYDTSTKRRKPAWCDRILWQVHADSFEGTKLTVDLLSYESHPSFRESDHRPVTADFLIRVLREPKELPVYFEPIEQWIPSRGETCNILINSDFIRSSWDWIGILKNDFSDFDQYVSYEWVPSSPVEKIDENTEMVTVRFSPSSLKDLDGVYLLCFYSAKKDCVVGYSDTFKISEAIHQSSDTE